MNNSCQFSALSTLFTFCGAAVCCVQYWKASLHLQLRPWLIYATASNMQLLSAWAAPLTQLFLYRNNCVQFCACLPLCLPTCLYFLLPDSMPIYTSADFSLLSGRKSWHAPVCLATKDHPHYNPFSENPTIKVFMSTVTLIHR